MKDNKLIEKLNEIDAVVDGLRNGKSIRNIHKLVSLLKELRKMIELQQSFVASRWTLQLRYHNNRSHTYDLVAETFIEAQKEAIDLIDEDRIVVGATLYCNSKPIHEF